MSCVWPYFTFPFPPDARLKKREAKKENERKKWSAQSSRDLELFLTINHSNEFTPQDFMIWCRDVLKRKPPHDNRAWSAIWCAASRTGKVEFVRREMRPTETRPDRYRMAQNVYKRKYK